MLLCTSLTLKKFQLSTWAKCCSPQVCICGTCCSVCSFHMTRLHFGVWIQILVVLESSVWGAWRWTSSAGQTSSLDVFTCLPACLPARTPNKTPQKYLLYQLKISATWKEERCKGLHWNCGTFFERGDISTRPSHWSDANEAQNNQQHLKRRVLRGLLGNAHSAFPEAFTHAVTEMRQTEERQAEE